MGSTIIRVERLDTGKIYESLKEASKDLFCSPDHLSKIYRKKTKNDTGVELIFYEDKKPRNQKKRVKNLTTGEVYESSLDAAMSINKLNGRRYINRAAKERKKAYGFYWSYL